VIKKQGSML